MTCVDTCDAPNCWRLALRWTVFRSRNREILTIRCLMCEPVGSAGWDKIVELTRDEAQVALVMES